MASERITEVNPPYMRSIRMSEPVVVSGHHSRKDFPMIAHVRDTVSDEECGADRECHSGPSDQLGCGARITSVDGEALKAECPAGALPPYTACAERILKAILEQL